MMQIQLKTLSSLKIGINLFLLPEVFREMKTQVFS